MEGKMVLQSMLFGGDSKLEAAAVSDAAHIVPGSSGSHVKKIQLALIQLDDARIVPDGIYGKATAAAVQAYKRKRNIVGTYQRAPDDIVGKLTTSALDRELWGREQTDLQKTILMPLPPPPPLPGYRRHLGQFLKVSKHLRDHDRAYFPVLATARGPTLANVVAPDVPQPPNDPRLELAKGETKRVIAFNAIGKIIEPLNPLIAKVVNPGDPAAYSLELTQNPQIVEVKGGIRGRTNLYVRTKGDAPRITNLLRVWCAMPRRIVKVGFQYLRAPANLETTLKPGAEDALLSEINEIFLWQANIFFRKISAADIRITGLRLVKGEPAITIERGDTDGPDWAKLIAARNSAADVNVCFVRDFSYFPKPGSIGLTHSKRATTTGQRDCLVRRIVDLASGAEASSAHTVAHELGHALGAGHAGQVAEDLMYEDSDGIRIMPTTAATMHLNLEAFPPK
jgi:peptidoglycan hydrolase-like protein with peptidoglycan-binding domain